LHFFLLQSGIVTGYDPIKEMRLLREIHILKEIYLINPSPFGYQSIRRVIKPVPMVPITLIKNDVTIFP
jgi:hypothetical protein